MNKKLILVLLLALALAQATDVTFNLANTRYTKASDYWTVDVPCQGGSGQYQYSCELPTGWRIESNLFKIPSSCSTNYNFEYVSRCRVKDIVLGQILERALAFKCTSTGYVITDKDYFYGLTSYTSGLGTISGIDVLSRLTSLAGSINTSFSSLSGSFTNLSQLSGYSSGYFTGLPAWADCDKYIKDGNIADILALIQKVVSSNTIRCDAKVAWLNDLLGRINAALEIKKESIAQLQALIDGIATQVQKLLVQIQTLKDEKTNINLAGLKLQIDALMQKLTIAYGEYNTCVASTHDLEVELAALQQEQKELETKIYQLQCAIDELIAKRNQLDIDIAALEKKLVELKAQRDQINVQIANYTAEWNAKKTRLEQVKIRIAEIVKKINEINANCAAIKLNYEQLEAQLKALQDKYNQGVARCDQITQQITSIQVEIDRINGQSSEYQCKLKAIQQCIDNLNSAIKQILQSIRYVQYQCHDCKDVVVIDKDLEPCFRFDRTNWFSYMSKCYGASVPQISVSFPNVTVEVKVITIYSPVFTVSYGSCFGDQIKTRGSQWDNQGSYGFDNDFSCSSGFDGLSSNKGKIRAINNKYVDVDCDDGQQIRLKLGSCSRFEGSGDSFVPKVGHNIHWKGAKNADSTFNLHTCSCY